MAETEDSQRVRVQRIVFVTGTTWAQEGQTTETMTRRGDGGYDVVFEYSARPGERQVTLEPDDARVFDEALERLCIFAWQSDIYKAPEPQGVRWSLLVEGDDFETLALQGATHAFPPGFPNFVVVMDEAFKAAAFGAGPDSGKRPSAVWHVGAVPTPAPALEQNAVLKMKIESPGSGRHVADERGADVHVADGEPPYRWHDGAVDPKGFPFAHSK